MSRKGTKEKMFCAVLGTVMAVTAISGCGQGKSSEAVSKHGGPYEEMITVDVFDNQANFQGIQSGWYAKVIKDKFNMELNIIAPNVAGGGDTLYQTRSANGNLGDLIITNSDQNRLKDLVAADLVLDMTDYVKECNNLNQYSDAILKTSALAEKEGTWAIPSEVSKLAATDPCEASNPTNAPSLRWDLYKEINYPNIDTLEDLLPILKKMQDNAGKSISGKNVYAISLFKDWDGDFMQNAGSFTALYGWDPVGFAFMQVDGNEIQSIIDEDSAYIRGLKFLFEANQMGLIDPESTTQNFDSLAVKYKDGAVLYSLWPWLGSGYYNTTENTAEGKGFASVNIGDAKYVTYGNMPSGKAATSIMIGSKAKDPQRLADFIDWLYSPEGIEMSATQTGGKCGPEGLTWELKDGQPILTEFGKKAFIDMKENLQVPSEWGGGTWKDGISVLNYNAVGLIEINEETGMNYNYAKWDDYINQTQNMLTLDWQAKNNAKTAIEYYHTNDLLAVIPGTNYAVPEYTTDILAIKEQCKQTFVEYSWKMVFAKDTAEFDQFLQTMKDTAKGLGFDQVYEVDKKNCADRYAAFAEAKK